jgi:hypothetical protein
MRRKPRDPETPILTGTLIIRASASSDFIMLVGAFGSFNGPRSRLQL